MSDTEPISETKMDPFNPTQPVRFEKTNTATLDSTDTTARPTESPLQTTTTSETQIPSLSTEEVNTPLETKEENSDWELKVAFVPKDNPYKEKFIDLAKKGLETRPDVIINENTSMALVNLKDPNNLTTLINHINSQPVFERKIKETVKGVEGVIGTVEVGPLIVTGITINGQKTADALVTFKGALVNGKTENPTTLEISNYLKGIKDAIKTERAISTGEPLTI